MKFKNIFSGWWGSKNASIGNQKSVQEAEVLQATLPSYASAIYKISAGSILFAFYYVTEKFSYFKDAQFRDTSLHVTNRVAMGLIFSGVNDIATRSISTWMAHRMASQMRNLQRPPSGKINSKKKKIALIASQKIAAEICSIEKLTSQAHSTFLRKQNILRHLINISSTGLAFLDSADMLLRTIKTGINPFGLSYPQWAKLRDAGPFLNFLNVPLTTPVTLLLSTLATGYNIRELALSLISAKPRRGDMPIFGFINAYTQVHFTKVVADIIAPDPPALDLVFPAGTPIDVQMKVIEDAMQRLNNPELSYLWWIAGSFNVHAAYYNYRNIMQLAINTRNLPSVIYDQVNRIIEVEDLPSAALSSLQNHTGIRRRHVSYVPPTNMPVQLHSSATAAAAAATPETSTTTTTVSAAAASTTVEPVTFMAPKIKTRGVPGVGYSAAVAAAVGASASSSTTMDLRKYESEEDEVHFDYDEKFRLEHLEYISELRRLRKPVKTKELLNELQVLRKILPNATIVDIDGSEHQLVWQFENRQYKLKYETPHGSHSEFIWGRLEKMLNVLEAGFLWGWDRAKQEAHLNQNRRGRGLEGVLYVLTERPTL